MCITIILGSDTSHVGLAHDARPKKGSRMDDLAMNWQFSTSSGNQSSTRTECGFYGVMWFSMLWRGFEKQVSGVSMPEISEPGAGIVG